MHGVLVIDKPAGRTSHDVVAEVSRRLGRVKAGHAGTLDPMATGVLVVCLGEATKLSGLLLADDKSYAGELELGAETDTLDADGQVVRERRDEAARIERAALEESLARVGARRRQIPPMVSALHHGGRRLHELARAGQSVEREPRDVLVSRFELVSFDAPRARFEVDCSKGTYVRVLVADAGDELGCGAHLTALRRTRSGRFGLERALALDRVEPVAVSSALVGLVDAIAHLPSATLDPAQAVAVASGKYMEWKDLSPAAAPAGPIVLLTPDRRLAALTEVDDSGRVRYRRVFSNPLT